MLVKELRIGNIVYDTKDRCIVTVTESDFHPTIYTYFEPVPLNDIWMVKLDLLNPDFKVLRSVSTKCIISVEKDTITDGCQFELRGDIK